MPDTNSNKKKIDSLKSPQRRQIIKTGACTAVVAAAMTQFGGLIGTVEAASASATESAELIYLNGKIHTVNDKQPSAEAFAVKDGRFAAVGSNNEIQALKGNSTKIIDLQGQFVMPGLIDEHIHPDMGADNYLNVFIAVTDKWDVVTRKLKDFRKKNPGKKWIYGSSIDWLLDNNGIMANYGVPSNKSVLDTIVNDRPIALYDQGAHAMLINSKAIEELGLNNDSPDPEGGILVKDKSGKLTGVIREKACNLVINALDNFSMQEWTTKGMVPFLKEMSTYGVTGISDAYANEKNAMAYTAMEKESKLNQWINLYMPSPLEFNDKERIQIQSDYIAGSSKYRSEQIYPAGIKYILDGAAAGKTAAMLKPFEGTDFIREIRYPEDDLKTDVTRYAGMGHAIKSHSIGDYGIRFLLDLYATLPKRNGAMHSIAHSVFVDPADVPRYKAFNTVYEASPALWFPNNAVPIIKADIGEERTAHAWPISRMVETGAVVSYGSDWTVSMTPNPWPGLEAMISRQLPGGSKEAFNPEFAVDLQTALKIFTLNGAVSMGIADKTGSIETGKSADFIVLNHDIFAISKFDIHKTKVHSTTFRGREVYSSADKG